MSYQACFIVPRCRASRRFTHRLWLSVLGILCVSCSESPSAPPPVTGDVREAFTIVALPDTQYYKKKRTDRFYAQTAWIRENVKIENIVFVTHMGDVVDDGAKETEEWTAASDAMSMLNGFVPWGVAIGNRDYDTPNDRASGASAFIKHFGPRRFKDAPWYAGAAPSELSSCQLFSGAGRAFMFLHLQLDCPKKDLAWAETMLNRYPNRATIVTTHSYLKGRNDEERNTDSVLKHGNSGVELWDKLIRRYPQIFMVLCGHQGQTVQYRQISTNDAGRPVIELLADYQAQPGGGDGTLRLLRFEPTRQRIHVRTYSAFRNSYDTDCESDFILPWTPPIPR